MNIPFFQCKKFKFSERNSFLINKGSLINNNQNETSEIKPEENCSQSEIDNLEIIEYPYTSNYKESEDFQINELNIKFDKKFDIFKDVIKHPKIFQEIDNNFFEQKDFNKNKYNSSSGLVMVNNDDNILNNKILTKNLFTTFASIRSNKKKINNYCYNKKTNNSNINTSRRKINNMIGFKADYTCPDNDNFLTKNNIYDSDKKSKEKKIKKKVNLKKCQNIKKIKTHILIPNNKINEKNTNKKNNYNIEIVSKHKNKSYNTYYIYINKSNSIFNEAILFKKKNKKKLSNRIIKHDSKGIKSIEEKKAKMINNLKNKEFIHTFPINKKEKSLDNINKDKNIINENYIKFFLNKINKKNNNNKNEILNYTSKIGKKNCILYNRLKDQSNHDINYSSKNYTNPFDNSEKKILRNIKLLNSMKSNTKLK